MSVALFVAAAALAFCAPTEAAPKHGRPSRGGSARPIETPAYPPRVAPRGKQRRPSSYGVDVLYQHHGYSTHRYTYPGYVNGFPPPAFLYYGYPQSGFSHGVGF